MDEVAPTLDEIMEPGFLQVFFQPVLRVGQVGTSLHSVEALVRGRSGSLFESAPLLYDFARRKGAEAPVDRACVRTALAQLRHLPDELPVRLNVHAATLHRDLEFGTFLCDTADVNGVAVQRLTIEIVEHAADWADYRLNEALDSLRHVGVRIALDDVGLGQSNFRMILDVRPDELKVDRYFVHGCAGDPYRCAILAAVVELSNRFGADLVAEGVENGDDLAMARGLRIELFQGHLFFPALRADEMGIGLERVTGDGRQAALLMEK